MKYTGYIIAALFIIGSLMIVIDYNNIGPDTSMLTYIGVGLCFIGLILLLPLETLISKVKKK